LNKNDPIEDFWQWFESNRKLYEELDDDQIGDHLDPIYQRLAEITPGLAVDISRIMPDGVRELVISANGNVELFPKVKEIVAAAPKFDRWAVIAFRQRVLIETVLEAEDLTLRMADMRFACFDEDGGLVVCIFAENIADEDKDKVFHFGMIMVDNLLGEYDTAMNLRAVDFRDIEQAPNDWPLRPLIELPDVVDQFHQRTNN
jgi:hypothetical protein